jgi:hypothetical protein
MKLTSHSLLFVLLLACCPVHAQSKADDTAVHQIPQAFAAAWAKHEGINWLKSCLTTSTS